MPGLTVRNALLFLPAGLVRGGLKIENGLIKEISKMGLPESDQEINADGNLIIPGVIDAHVHFFDPNFSHREDFESGSKAAAAGGVTSIISMPLDTPVLSPDQIEDEIEDGEKNSIIDFGLHSGNMTEDSKKYISSDVALGVKTFKIFTSRPYALGKDVRRELMGSIEEAGGIAFVHAEDDKIIQKREEELKKAGRRDPLAHAESRPNEAERKAVSEIISDQREIGFELHFAHITTRQSIELLEKVKSRGGKITAETCPHYLLFTEKDLQDRGAYLRTNPPLRTKKDVAKLWKSLSEGTIKIITTDHAPGTLEEKDAGANNIWDAQIGIPGVETLLPVMFSEGVIKKRLSLGRLINALCTSPAKRFGLYPRKGTIEEGTDADLVIIDREKTTKITDGEMHYKVGWTPYEGMEIRGVPITTISRGEIIAHEGEIIGDTGRGEFLSFSN